MSTWSPRGKRGAQIIRPLLQVPPSNVTQGSAWQGQVLYAKLDASTCWLMYYKVLIHIRRSFQFKVHGYVKFRDKKLRINMSVKPVPLTKLSSSELSVGIGSYITKFAEHLVLGSSCQVICKLKGTDKLICRNTHPV